MIKKITVTNYLGESIEIDLGSPEKSGLFISKIDGLGPAIATINNTELATADGTLFNSARLSSRNIVLNFKYYAINESIESIRLKTYKYFPIKKMLTFQIETDSRLAYCIGYVENNQPDIFNEKSGCQISIICPDPYFYSAGIDGTKETIFSSLVNEFEFPFENNSLTVKLMEMGDIQPLREHNVYYDGDSENGIMLYIHALGETGDITIYNVTTREHMTISNSKLEILTGNGISVGDTITVCTIRGKKSIMLLRNGVETNILNVLDKNSSWIQLIKGDNIFAYTTERESSALQLRLTYRIIYEGV